MEGGVPVHHRTHTHHIIRRLGSAVCLFLLLLTTLMVAGCHDLPSGFVGGETLTPERLQEISASLFPPATEPEVETAAVPSTVPSAVPSPDLSAIEGTVYWTDGGSVLHIDESCYHLGRSDTVHSGSVEEAVAAGKTRLCATCRDRHAATETTVSPSEEGAP